MKSSSEAKFIGTCLTSSGAATADTGDSNSGALAADSSGAPAAVRRPVGPGGAEPPGAGA